jgi:hypothetical protein
LPIRIPVESHSFAFPFSQIIGHIQNQYTTAELSAKMKWLSSTMVQAIFDFAFDSVIEHMDCSPDGSSGRLMDFMMAT